MIQRLNLRLSARIILILILSAPVFASFQKGVELFQMARYRDAYQAFEKAIKAKDRVGDSYYFLGKIFLQSHDYPKAHGFFLRAILKESSQKLLIEDFSTSLEEMRNILSPEKFQALNQKAFDHGVFAIPVIYYLIKNLHNQRNFEGIISLIEQAQNKPSFNLGQRDRGQNLGLIYYYLALAHLRHDKDELRALKAARVSVKSDPQLSIAKKLHSKLLSRQKKLMGDILEQAHFAFAQKDYKLASSSYEHALLIQPGLSEALDGIAKIKRASESSKVLLAARSLAEKGRYELALKKLGFAITAWPENFEAVNYRKELEAKILERHKLKARDKEDKKSLEQRYFIALSTAKNNLNGGELTQAVSAFEKALKLRPDSSEAAAGLKAAKNKLDRLQIYQKALAQFEAGKNALALPIFKKLHDQGFVEDGLFQALILAHFHLEHYLELIELAEERLRVHPREIAVIYHLGRAWEALIEKEPQALTRALEAYAGVLAIESEFLDAQGRRNRLLRIRYAPLALWILGFLAVLIVGVWLYKTKDLRRKLRFLNQVEKAAASQDHDSLAKLYAKVNEINLSLQETLKILPAFMTALVQLERYEDGLKLGPRILSAHPEHNQARILMALCYYGIKRFDGSLMKYFATLFNSEYLSEEITRWIGPRVVDLNLATPDTLPVLKRFVELVPEHGKARKALLELLDKESTPTRQVVQLLEREIQDNSSEIRSRLRLAKHYLAHHKIDDCIRLCEEVLNLDPGHRDLHSMLYQAYSEHKTLDELLPIYDALLELQPNSIVLQEAKNRILLATDRDALTQSDLNRQPPKSPDGKS